MLPQDNFGEEISNLFDFEHRSSSISDFQWMRAYFILKQRKDRLK